MNGLTIGDIQDGLFKATERGGAWGKNMHPSKEVLVRIDETYYPIRYVSCSFVNGSFVMIFDATGDKL